MIETSGPPPRAPAGWRGTLAGALAGDLVKRVDLAVYEAFKTAKDGSWKAGVRNLGAAEGGVGYAVDEHDRGLITADMEKKLQQARRHHDRQDQGDQLRLHVEVVSVPSERSDTFAGSPHDPLR